MEPKGSLPCLQVPNHHPALRLHREYSYTSTTPLEFMACCMVTFTSYRDVLQHIQKTSHQNVLGSNPTLLVCLYRNFLTETT